MRIHRSCVVGLGHVATVGRSTVQVPHKTLLVSEGYRKVVDAFFTN